MPKDCSILCQKLPKLSTRGTAPICKSGDDNGGNRPPPPPPTATANANAIAIIVVIVVVTVTVAVSVTVVAAAFS